MYIVDIIGIGAEANPIGRFLIQNQCAEVGKFVIAPIAMAIIGYVVWRDKRFIWSWYILIGIYSCAVINNFIVLSRL